MPGTTISERECDMRHESVEKDLLMLGKLIEKVEESHNEAVKSLTSTVTILKNLEDRIKSQEDYGKEASAKPKKLIETVKTAIIVTIATAFAAAVVGLIIISN
jgi:folate-dependent tRNA-U54 methylase TrmFO/GidA